MARIAILVSIASFLFISLLGVFHFMPTMGGYTSCPLMPGMNVCPMDPLAHAVSFQSTLSGVPHLQSLTTLLLSLLLVAFLGLAWFRRSYRPPLVLRESPFRLYYQRLVPIETALQSLFSDGILNPKRF